MIIKEQQLKKSPKICERTRSEKTPRSFERRKRSDCFFGLHFDFHADVDSVEIGKSITSEMIGSMLDSVKPDYVQCDCKGHRGVASYPSELGNAAPGFIKDPLRIWRDETALRKTSLYIHYSGVWDSGFAGKHPEWARISGGSPDKHCVSVFGEYADLLMIPQICEVISKYDIDGVWVDADCWAVGLDYCQTVLNVFKSKYGCDSLPRNSDEKYFKEFTEYCRQGFRDYLKKYVDKFHEYRPGLQIASNWAYTSYMPEKVDVDIDYISGDCPSINTRQIAQFESRCMVHQGKPWDLMIWGFAYTYEKGMIGDKSPVQLKQESASLLAQGGGIQLYFPQKKDGAIYEKHIPIAAEVAAFCRDRKPFCHNEGYVPQIAMLHSAGAYYETTEWLFCARDPFTNDSPIDYLRPSHGLLSSLIDSNYIVDVIMDHHLDEIDRYGLIVIPELKTEAGIAEKLIEYVKRGGSLLVVGKQNSQYFCSELSSVEEDDLKGEPLLVQSIEKGEIGILPQDIGETYFYSRNEKLRSLIFDSVKQLFSCPLVELGVYNKIEVAANKVNGELFIHLINMSKPAGHPELYDNVPCVKEVSAKIRYDHKPNSIWIEPEHRKLPFIYKDGTIEIVVPSLHIHSILVVK